MRRAIELAGRNPSQPFGCVIVDAEGTVVSEAFNEDENPVRHAETVAIHDLAAKSPGVDRSTLTLFTTAEPCPMCAAAILWAGIGGVIVGTSLGTLISLELPHINIPMREVCDRASGDFTPPQMEFGVLEAECDELYKATSR